MCGLGRPMPHPGAVQGIWPPAALKLDGCSTDMALGKSGICFHDNAHDHLKINLLCTNAIVNTPATRACHLKKHMGRTYWSFQLSTLFKAWWNCHFCIDAKSLHNKRLFGKNNAFLFNWKVLHPISSYKWLTSMFLMIKKLPLPLCENCVHILAHTQLPCLSPHDILCMDLPQRPIDTDITFKNY